MHAWMRRMFGKSFTRMDPPLSCSLVPPLSCFFSDNVQNFYTKCKRCIWGQLSNALVSVSQLRIVDKDEALQHQKMQFAKILGAVSQRE